LMLITCSIKPMRSTKRCVIEHLRQVLVVYLQVLFVDYLALVTPV